MLRRTLIVVIASGVVACAYTEAPTTRECEAAADNLLRLDAGARAGGEVLGLLAGTIAPAAGRVTGRRAQVVARCEAGWNRKLAGCVRVAATLDELKECRAYPWADPVEVTR